MNSKLRDLQIQAFAECKTFEDGQFRTDEVFERFAELIKQAIYDDVKEELIDDAIINEEPDRLSREYLKGCNGGTVDALRHIKNFGVDIEL